MSLETVGITTEWRETSQFFCSVLAEVKGAWNGGKHQKQKTNHGPKRDKTPTTSPKVPKIPISANSILHFLKMHQKKQVKTIKREIFFLTLAPSQGWRLGSISSSLSNYSVFVEKWRWFKVTVQKPEILVWISCVVDLCWFWCLWMLFWSWNGIQVARAQLLLGFLLAAPGGYQWRGKCSRKCSSTCRRCRQCNSRCSISRCSHSITSSISRCNRDSRCSINRCNLNKCSNLKCNSLKCNNIKCSINRCSNLKCRINKCRPVSEGYVCWAGVVVQNILSKTF